MEILLCWIGNADLSAAEHDDPQNIGPIAQSLAVKSYDKAILLDNYKNERVERFLEWLQARYDAEIVRNKVELSSPTNHKEIYEAARELVSQVSKQHTQATLTFHISPGTPAMALVWMLLAPRWGATLIESSKIKGVQQVQLPFEIAAYFLPDRELERIVQSDTPPNSAFKNILHKSSVMKAVVANAQIVAPRNITVLIEGESGTGKELFARAIHASSLRARGPFIPVNCGAIPAELIEAQLFGYKKGAFTNAEKDTKGYFQAANGGTLFLDELGELPLSSQVKLLRALEEQSVLPVGATKEEKIDVRIIAATNRNLFNEVCEGKFRSDLFYRLAVGILHIPPLRDRREDLEMLLEAMLQQANEELVGGKAIPYKKFSESAKKIMLNHHWPGNVRELKNTVMRSVLWTSNELIDAEAARNALLAATATETQILGRPLGSGFSLNILLDIVSVHYLKRAMDESNGNKTKAAELLGFENYQTLNNKLSKYNLH